jgi:hypothetical protein
MKEHKNTWWLVPVIKGGGNCDPEDPSKVVNWAAIFPTEVKATGNPKYVKAHIICDPSLPRTIIPGALCYANRLVREPAKGM